MALDLVETLGFLSGFASALDLALLNLTGNFLALTEPFFLISMDNSQFSSFSLYCSQNDLKSFRRFYSASFT